MTVHGGHGLRGAAGFAASPFTKGPYEWDQIVTFTRTQSSATPGSERSIIGKQTTYSSMTSGTLVGVRGEVNIAASCTVTGSYLYGAQGKLIMAASSVLNVGSGHACGVLGQLDISNGTTTSGHIACVIASIQDTTGTARPYVNGFYAELPAYGSGALMHSVLQGVGAAATGIDLAGIGGCTALIDAPSAVAGAADGSGAAVYINVKINGVAARLTGKYVT